MVKKIADFNYRTAAAELEKLLAALQDPDIQIEEATRLHARGTKLVDELEAYLLQAENKVHSHTEAG